MRLYGAFATSIMFLRRPHAAQYCLDKPFPLSLSPQHRARCSWWCRGRRYRLLPLERRRIHPFRQFIVGWDANGTGMSYFASRCTFLSVLGCRPFTRYRNATLLVPPCISCTSKLPAALFVTKRPLQSPSYWEDKIVGHVDNRGKVGVQLHHRRPSRDCPCRSPPPTTPVPPRSTSGDGCHRGASRARSWRSSD